MIGQLGKLVKFSATSAKRELDDIGPPPDDSIAGASWLSRVLRRELSAVLADPTIRGDKRRAEILRFARAITASTPNHEIYEAREAVRADERESSSPKLSGEVVRRVATGRSRSLRAHAPRGKA